MRKLWQSLGLTLFLTGGCWVGFEAYPAHAQTRAFNEPLLCDPYNYCTYYSAPYADPYNQYLYYMVPQIRERQRWRGRRWDRRQHQRYERRERREHPEGFDHRR